MAALSTWMGIAHDVEFGDFLFKHLLNLVEDRFFRWNDAVEVVHVHDGSDLGVECARIQLRRFLQFCQIGRKSRFNGKILQHTGNPIPRRSFPKLTRFRWKLLGSRRSFWMSDRHLFSVVGIVFERGIRYSRHIRIAVFRNTETRCFTTKRALRQ